MKQIVLELGQLPGPGHGRAIDQQRRQHFPVAMLCGVHIQHVIDERPLESGSRSGQYGKAGFGHAHRTVEIQNAERFAKIPVGLGRSRELRRRSPSAHFNIVSLIPAVRDRGVREVRNAQRDMGQLFFHDTKLFLMAFDRLSQGLHRRHGLIGRLLLSLQPGDVVRSLFQLVP